MQPTFSVEEMYQIIYQDHCDPRHILGPHLVSVQDEKAVAIRCFLPDADRVSVKADDKHYPMGKIHESGFFEAVCRDQKQLFPYKLKVNYTGKTSLICDPYAYTSLELGEIDIHLLKKGSHYKSFEKLGAHLKNIDGVFGVHFSVWAPNARCVSVIGSFNGWDRRLHMMSKNEASGIWEIFIPDIGKGTVYKYQIGVGNNRVIDKADPYGFHTELSPQTASVVYDIDKYDWNDENWMNTRSKKHGVNVPISIYEVHAGSWIREIADNSFLNYRRLVKYLVSYVKEMGYTHIELLPIQEHPFYGSWGYQTIGYYAPSSRYGTPDDFMYFVDYCHQNDIGVLLDWAPAHFPSDGHGLAFFDGTYLYEHENPRQRRHNDWNTNIYNYGRYEVKNFLISSALFWMEKYHIDGLRVDAVASMLHLDYSKSPGEWVPNKYGGRENLEAITFIKELNDAVKKYYPGTMMVAEESTTWPMVSKPTYLGGLGFDYKWNMGWMNDILKYMGTDPIYRKFQHQTFSFSIWYTFSENFMLPLSHDEVVHGKRSLLDKMPGNVWKKFANLRLLYGYMYAHPGKKMLFMGGEFGQWREWNHDSALDWELLEYDSHRKLKRYVRDLNFLYRDHPALYEVETKSEGFEWVDYHDAEYSILSFWRKCKSEELLFVFNFTPVLRRDYRLGIQKSGEYREIFNSDSSLYWGSNVGNMGKITAQKTGWHGKPYYLNLTLPPLGVLVFHLSSGQLKKQEPKQEKTGQKEKDEQKDISANKAENIS